MVNATESVVVPAGSVFEVIAVRETSYVGPTVTTVVSAPLTVAGGRPVAIRITDPPVPEPLIVQSAVTGSGRSPGDRVMDVLSRKHDVTEPDRTVEISKVD